MDERDDCIALDCPLQYLYQLGMVDRVEEAFKVYVYCMVVVLFNYLCRGYQRLIASPPGAEAAASLAELSFIDGT